MGAGGCDFLRRRLMEKKQEQAAGQGQGAKRAAVERAVKACMCKAAAIRE